MPYLIVIIVVLIASPFILRLAQSQKKEVKRKLKFALLILLTTQIILGFLNWENFTAGRSGFELSLTYLDTFLGLFFAVSAVQILLLLFGRSLNILVVGLNFINTFLLFTGMIRLSNMLGFQVVSWASVATVFLMLFGNLIGLAYINKDKNLLRKYPFLK